MDMKELYSTITEKVNNAKTSLKVGATGLALLALTGCAGMQPKPDFYPTKGAEHTLTYIDDKTGKEVTNFDLTGKWETEYYGNKEVVIIEQDKNRFLGYKTFGNEYVDSKSITLSGTVEGNILECNVHWKSGKTTYNNSKLNEKVDKFECQADRILKYERVK